MTQIVCQGPCQEYGGQKYDVHIKRIPIPGQGSFVPDSSAIDSLSKKNLEGASHSYCPEDVCAKIHLLRLSKSQTEP